MVNLEKGGIVLKSFTGEYHHNIDTKGRLIIPAKLREGLGESFMLTKGQDNCLYAYPMEEWGEVQRKMRDQAQARADNLAFMRNFFSSASDCETDNLGRILVAPTLRDYADLNGKKEVAVLGIFNRVEIWNKERWEEYCKENSDSMDINTGMQIYDI